MKDFLQLPIQKVTDSFDPFEDSFPTELCKLTLCKHGRVFTKGQTFVRFERSFVHTDCLDALVKSLDRTDFLMLLAAHVAIAPSRHNAGTLRQVITSLRTALGRTQLELENAKAKAYAQGTVDAAVAIAEAGGSVSLPIDVEAAIRDGEDEDE